jgi:hypothetical protein
VKQSNQEVEAKPYKELLKMRRLIGIVMIITTLQSLLYAHATPRSSIFMDLSDRRIALEIYLSIDELSFVSSSLANALESLSNPHSQQTLITYLEQHLHLKDIQGIKQTLHYSHFAIDDEDSQPYLKVNAFLKRAKPLKKITLDCDLLIHKVNTHQIFLMLRSDFNQGIFEDEGKIVDIFDDKHSSSQIDRTDKPNSGFKTMLTHGMKHITQGSDHLLFLYTLLLPLPLVLLAKRWSMKRRPIGLVAYETIKTITAFSIGHTITLGLATFKIVDVWTQGVEVFVALSISIASIHAIYPLMRHFIFITTLLFGMIHGLAFSEVLVHFNLDLWSQTISLLGFSLGVELMQLLLTLLVMPLLLIITLSPQLYYGLRLGSALFALIASLAWGASRIMDEPYLLAEHFDQLSSQGIYYYWLLSLLGIVSLLSHLYLSKKSI